MHELENPIWHALTGPQACYAQRVGGAARYQDGFAQLAGLERPDDPDGWDDLAAVTQGQRVIVVTSESVALPADWQMDADVRAIQMVAPPRPESMSDDPRIVELSANTDAADAIALVEKARPGPFGPRSLELGGYLGVRVNGRLIAMAGRRARSDNWVEISAVCTDPSHRHQGIGAALVYGLERRIWADGARPYLHVAENNIGAVRLYEKMGYVVSRAVHFLIVRHLSRVVTVSSSR